MKVDTFVEFWNKWTDVWYESAKCCEVNRVDLVFPVNQKCRIPHTAAVSVYQVYQELKAITKGIYFEIPDSGKAEDIKLSRYKRAAVLINAILNTACLAYFEEYSDINDPYLLKERLAFFMGIASIIQTFPENKVNALINSTQGPIYLFNELDIDREADADDFLQSVYKDLYYSKYNENYNVLTMANLLGVLTERASTLIEIIKPNDS